MLLVMYSHYPWDSMGFLLSLILTLLTITVTPSHFLSIYPPVSLFPPPPQLPWRFIVALTERPLPSPSECWEGCISRISSSAVSFLRWIQIQHLGLCVSMPVFQSLTFTRQKTCLTSPLACPLTKHLGNQAFERHKTHLSPDSSACKLVRKQLREAKDNKKQKRQEKRAEN